MRRQWNVGCALGACVSLPTSDKPKTPRAVIATTMNATGIKDTSTGGNLDLIEKGASTGQPPNAPFLIPRGTSTSMPIRPHLATQLLFVSVPEYLVIDVESGACPPKGQAENGYRPMG